MPRMMPQRPTAVGCMRWLDGLAGDNRKYMLHLEYARVIGPFSFVGVALEAVQATVFDVQHTPGWLACPLNGDFCVASGKERGLCLRGTGRYAEFNEEPRAGQLDPFDTRGFELTAQGRQSRMLTLKQARQQETDQLKNRWRSGVAFVALGVHGCDWSV